MRALFILWSLIAIVCSLLLAGIALTKGPRTVEAAPAKPFNVYETPAACIYVVGYNPPAIAAVPRGLYRCE